MATFISQLKHRWNQISIPVVLAILLAILVPVETPIAHAATLTVTDCSAPSGAAGRLVDTINAAASGDTINFSCSGTIVLSSTITINKNLIIDGTGQTVTISGGNSVSVFIVNSSISFNLQNLSVSNGRATSSMGGAVYNNGGTLQVTNVTFSNNSAVFGGGAIANSGTLIATNSTFSTNSALQHPSFGGGYGGAIYNFSSTGNATISQVTLNGNTADLMGGGIFNDRNSTMQVTNATLASNSAQYGGGIYNSQTATISNVTLSANTALVSGGGGGFNNQSSATVTNTIIANSSGNNCAGTVSTGNNNLANDATCGGTFTNSSNILLGALGSYGGANQTYPPLPGSVAIDAGASCPSTDQRGVSRVGTCDVGAFESQKFTFGSLTGTPQSTQITTAFPTALGLTVSSAFGEPVDGGKVTFTPPASGASASLSSTAVTISSGTVSTNATANNIVGGPYNVVASTNGAPSANFSLANTKFVPTISTDVHDASHAIITSASIASDVHDRAVITGTVALPAPTGSITFTLYSAATNCTGSSTTQVVPLSGNSAESSPVSVTNTGMSYLASYSGDANYATVNATCEPLAANKLNATVNTDVHTTSHAITTTVPIGTLVHDKAAVSGTASITPTGTVTFTLYSSATNCTGTSSQSVVSLSSGSAESSDVSVSNTGLSYLVSYGGDANYSPNVGGCEPLTVTTLTATVNTNIHIASTHAVTTTVAVGTLVHDKATLSGTAGITPTGTVTFTLYSSATNCTGASTQSTASLANGNAESSDVSVSNTGLSYLVSYGGDANYNPGVGVCEPLTITKLNTTINTDVHNASHSIVTTVPIGTLVHDSATATTVSGITPTGNVTFTLYSSATNCTGTSSQSVVSLSSGSAESSSVNVSSTGLSYLVSYGGDANFNPAVGTCEPLNVTKLTATVNTDIHNPSHSIVTTVPIGTSVHDQATVSGTSGITPTGTVTFTLYSSAANCTGASTQSTASLVNGSAESSNVTAMSTGLSYLASYAGDANYNPAVGTCEPLTTTKLDTTINTNIHNASHGTVTSVSVGTLVHDNATASTVSGITPTGNVTFTLYSNTTNCTGASTQSVVSLSGGSAESAGVNVSITGLSYLASYGGDVNFNPAAGTCESLTATKVTPTVNTDVHNASHIVITSVQVNSSVHDSATVVAVNNITPTGNITFTLYNTATDCTGTSTTQTLALVNGAGESSSTTVPVSGLSYKVSYEGDNNYNFGVGSCEPLTALVPDLTISKSNNVGGTTTVNTAFNWTLTITNTGTGVTTFVAPQIILTDTLPSSGATYGTPSTANIVGVMNSSNISCSIVGNDLTCAAIGAVTINTSGHFDIVIPVTPTAQGSLTNPRGGGICTVDPNNVVTESNESNNTCATNSVTVNKKNTTTVLTSSPNPSTVGQTVVFTATVTGSSGTPSGTVNLFDNGAPLGTITLSSGVGTYSTNAFIVGIHPITGTYSGDIPFNASTSNTINQQVKTNQTINITTSAPGSAVFGSTFVVSATASSGLPVAFSSGSPTICTNVGTTFTMVSGTGTCVVQYDQAGDATYNPAPQQTQNVTATKATPNVNSDIHNATHAITTTSPIGTSIHDNAIVTSTIGTVPGTVTFYRYSDVACAITVTTQASVNLVNGSAESSSINVPSLGGLSYRAKYDGNANYNSAFGPCEPLTATQATPSVTTDIHDASHNVLTSASIGATVHDKATVTGNAQGGIPTGSVTFTVYTNTTCAAPGTNAGTINLNASGVADPSNTAIAPASGLSFMAHYSGDTNYLAADGACEPLTTNKSNPTITIAVHDASHTNITGAIVGSANALVGSTVHGQSTLSGTYGTPTGTVSFTVYNGSNCGGTGTTAGTIPLASGTADPSNPSIIIGGGLSFKAHYNGDSTYNSIDSNCAGLGPLPNIYLPFIGKSTGSQLPDLIVQSITPTANGIQVVIKNQGDAPVINDFWVDLYVNPNPAPTHVNQIWNDLSTYGAVWGYLASAQPINPGATITLTLGDAYYWASLSNMPSTLPSGTYLYAQVDSAHVLSTYGNVLENHEYNGGPYNNISSAQLTTPVTLKVPASTRAPSIGKLPNRK